MSSLTNMDRYLRSHELGSTAERARRLTIPHFLLAKTVISDLYVPIEGEKDVIELQIAAEPVSIVEEREMWEGTRAAHR